MNVNQTSSHAGYLVVLFVFESNLFSPIFRLSDALEADDDGVGLKSPFRLTVGAARTVSLEQSLHGLFERSNFPEGEDDDFVGPTVGTVVAERLETGADLDAMYE